MSVAWQQCGDALSPQPSTVWSHTCCLQLEHDGEHECACGEHWPSEPTAVGALRVSDQTSE